MDFLGQSMAPETMDFHIKYFGGGFLAISPETNPLRLPSGKLLHNELERSSIL